MTQAPGKGRKRSVRRTAGEETHTCAACFLYKSDSKEAYCTCCLNNGGVIRGVPAAGQARTLSALARNELLCLGTEVVHLNALDESLCSDLDDCYCAARGKLFIYPMSAYIVPALFVATLFVNGIARGAGKKANLPNVLWYTTTDGRDLLSRLKFGKKREEVSSISGLTRLNAEGERIGSGSRNKRLFVSAHAVLPKDQLWCPTVLIADGRQFDDGQLTELLASALRRWPGILIYVVTANPMTSLVAFFKDQSWESSDYAGALGDYKMKAVRCRNEFDSIALQLTNVDHGVDRVIETVADQPSAAWSELRDVLPLAKRSVKLLATARLFIAAAKWLSGLPLRPSEFEAHRSVFMSSFDDWLQKIRQVSKQEGNTAQLIAGATTILREVYRDLERQNPKREALFDSIRECEALNQRVVLVVQRQGMRNVLVQSLLASRIDGKLERDWVHRDSDALAVITVSQLPRAAICDLVLIPSTLPPAMLWAVRTAIAPRIKILSYGSEAALWSWCLREMGASGVQEFVRQPQSEASVEPRDHTVAFQEDAPEAALLLDLRTLVAEDIETALNEASAVTATGPRRQITFDDGSHVFVGESSMLQVLEEGEQLKSKRARDIKAADLVLVTNSGPLNNIFEVLRDRVDSQTSLARAVEIVNAYHSLLLHAFQVSGLTHQQLLHRLRALGSTILHTISIVEWVDGERFGPSDPLDIERLGSTLGIEVFSKYDQFYAAMQRVRIAHRELGRALVRIVRASFKEADASSIRLTIDGEEIVMYDVSEAIAIKRVVSAAFVAVTDEQSIPTNSRSGLFTGEGDDPMV